MIKLYLNFTFFKNPNKYGNIIEFPYYGGYQSVTKISRVCVGTLYYLRVASGCGQPTYLLTAIKVCSTPITTTTVCYSIEFIILHVCINILNKQHTLLQVVFSASSSLNYIINTITKYEVITGKRRRTLDAVFL